MNIAPEDVDIYDPLAFVVQPMSRLRSAHGCRLIEQRGGLVDAYRALHPTDQQFTWWDYRAGNFHKNLGLRIDLALVSTDLAKGLTECGIDRNFRKGAKPSDPHHCWCVLSSARLMAWLRSTD